MVGFMAKAYRFDSKMLKSKILRVTNKVLRFNCHEFGVEPLFEDLLDRRLIPLILLILICLFQRNNNRVWFYFCKVKEMFVNFFVSVNMRTSEIVCFPNSFFSFNTIVNCKSHIIGHNWLDLAIHAFDHEVHSVEHLHLHAPLGSDCGDRVEVVEHVSRSNNGHVREDLLHFLLTDPLSSQTS